MWITAKAVVQSPSDKLVNDAHERNLSELRGDLPDVTRRGHVVFNLRVNVKRSAELYPDSWMINPKPTSSHSAAHLPRTDVSLAVHVFDMPEVLVGEEVSWRVQKSETNAQRLGGESCTIVASVDGAPLSPYYRAANRNTPWLPHATDSYFSATQLSYLYWARRKEDGLAVWAGLGLRKLSIGLENGVVTARQEAIYRDERLELADYNHAGLEELPSQWNDALHGLRARMDCAYQSRCEGHYHLESSF